MILRSLNLAASSGSPWNLSSLEALQVRDLAAYFGRVLGKPPRFKGRESENALLSNASRICAALGKPPTPLERVMSWTAEWVRAGGRLLNKPTHFEVRDGQY